MLIVRALGPYLLTIEMRVVEEGEEFIVENLDRWADFQPQVGTILEVDGSSTDQPFPPGLWLAFVVMGSTLEDDGSMILEAKFVGSEEAEVNKELSATFNRRKGVLHLCGGKPCIAAVEALHVTRFRVYSVDEYKKDFLTPSMTRQMKKWAGTATEPRASEVAPRVPGRRAALKKPPGEAVAPPGEAKAPWDGGSPSGEIGRLSVRLEELRHRLHTARPGTKNRVEPPDPFGDVEELGSSTAGDSDCALEALETGTEIVPRKGQQGSTTLRASSKTKARKKKKKRDSSNLYGAQRHGKEEKKKDLLAISDGTSKGMQSQLALKAAAVAKEKARERDHSKRPSGSSVGKKLLKILTGKKETGRGSSKDKRKRKRLKDKEKRRRHIKPDPDGSEDGPTGSSGSSYSSGWGSDVDSLSDMDELEPPLRKRAKQHPGSVLKMLLSHARSQLDQSSKVALDPNMSVDVTSGVKMASYFSICVRPGLPQNMGAQRDLHHLSLAIDLLRQGDLTLLGDCLASRFVAIHQAAMDGGWNAARHLELFPLEDGGATSNTVLLEARRHARLAAKAAGLDPYSWKGSGKGKGGRKGKKGHWENQDLSEKGSGKKGKERGSQKGWWGQGDPNKWKENKEAPQDKKS